MEKTTAFRLWLHQIWLDNCAEHDAFGELPYTKEEYWRRYKYWLRREYRYQQRQKPYQSPAIRTVVEKPTNVSAY